MIKIAIGPSSFAAIDKTPLKILKEKGIEVVPNPFGRRLKEDEIIEHLKGIDGLIAGLEPLNEKVLLSNSKLRAIARVGIGMTNVDLKKAKELNIKVSNTPDGPTYSVAEMAITALLSLCRNVVSTNKALHNKEWKKEIGLGLNGLRVLLIGYGRIGKKVSELLKVFGAEVIVVDPYITDEDLLGHERLVDLKEGLKDAEVISLHAAGVNEILGENEFEMMRDDVIILNSARGELINENCMIKYLDSGKIRGAWFDAFWQEPYTGKLTEYDQVILSPHVGTYTKQCRSSMEVSAVENILKDLGVE